MKKNRVTYQSQRKVALIRKGNKRSGLRIKLRFGPSSKFQYENDVCFGCIFWNDLLHLCTSPKYSEGGDICCVLLENDDIVRDMRGGGYNYVIPHKIL